jgi:predicted ATP-dependent endonuclease of OLD family
MELKTFKVVNFLGLNKNVELKFQDNKLIMVGENGSGKSQLMRMFTLFFNDLEGLANRNFEKIIVNINGKEIVVIKDKLKKDYSNFDEEYIDSIRKQIKDETNGIIFAYIDEFSCQQYHSVEDTFLKYLTSLNLMTNQKFFVGEYAIRNVNFFSYDYFDAIKSCINLIRVY